MPDWEQGLLLLFWELWRAQDKLSASPALCFLAKWDLLEVLDWLSAFGELFMECWDGDPYQKPLTGTSVPCNPLGSFQ